MAKRRRKKTSRNLYTPRYFLANGRRSLARLMRNPDMGVLLGIGMGALGFVAARVLTRESARITSLPAYVKDNAGMVIPAVGAVATLALAKPLNLSDSTRNLIVAGMGIAAVDQALRRSNQPLLMASYAAPPPVQIPAPVETPAAAPDAGPAAGSYYEEGDVMGSYFDVSHQGAPYKGLLGLGEAMYATAGLGANPFSALIQAFQTQRPMMSVNARPVITPTVPRAGTVYPTQPSPAGAGEDPRAQYLTESQADAAKSALAQGRDPWAAAQALGPIPTSTTERDARNAAERAAASGVRTSAAPMPVASRVALMRGDTVTLMGLGEYVSQPVLGETMYATAGMGSYPTRARGGSPILGEYVSQPVLGDIMYATAGIEQVATITPSDGVRKAQFMPPVRPITTPFVNPARGSGLFYGSLFSGTM